VLFSDYKDEHEGMDDSMSFLGMNYGQNVDKDKHLNKYQGLLFSLENMSFKSYLSLKKSQDGNDILMKNSNFDCNFLRLAYLKSESLFSIRSICFQNERDNQSESSLDNYKNFCVFFDVKENQMNNQTELQQNTIMRNFKTLFPVQIVKNTHIQKDILLSQLHPDSFNPLFTQTSRQ